MIAFVIFLLIEIVILNTREKISNIKLVLKKNPDKEKKIEL